MPRNRFAMSLMLTGLLAGISTSTVADTWTFDVHVGGTADTPWTTFGIDTALGKFTNVFESPGQNPKDYPAPSNVNMGILFTVAGPNFAPPYADNFVLGNNADFNFDVYPQGNPGALHSFTAFGTLTGTMTGTAGGGGTDAVWSLTRIKDNTTNIDFVNTASFFPNRPFVPAWQVRVIISGKPLYIWFDTQVPVPAISTSTSMNAYIADAPAFVTISGRIALQRVANSIRSIDFTFRSTTGFPFTRTAILDATGAYALSNIPLGNYTVHVKGTKWLAKNIMVDARFGDVATANATLSAGDANNDNVCDISDLLLLIAHYNQTASNVGYLDAADFNCDGSDDIGDLLLLIANYNRQGDS